MTRFLRPSYNSSFDKCGRLLSILAIAVMLVGCVNRSVPPSYPVTLLSKSDFIFEGGFFLPDQKLGVSSTNWTQGVIEVHEGALFIVGNEQEDALAEFAIPPTLLSNADIDSMPVAGIVRQQFASVFNRIQNNRDGLDKIVGLELFEGKLIANAVEYYDAPADNRQTTFVLEQSSDLASSTVSGMYGIEGGAKAAGWLSVVPPEWQQLLGCTHLSGSSSGGPIITRYSIGPSAYCINLAVFDEYSTSQTIPTRELLGFSMNNPLREDLLNESHKNKLWTHLSRATYGFIVPGTATYATFGYSGGHQSGVGYKLPRHSGVDCDGYCSVDPADNANYYWLWDVRDLWRVATGRKDASYPRPYDWGEWDIPLDATGFRLGGGAYDDASGNLYFTLLDLQNEPGGGVNPPAVVGYRIGR